MYGFATREVARLALKHLRDDQNNGEPDGAIYKIEPHSWREGTNIPTSWGVARYVPYRRTNGNDKLRFDGFVWFE